MAWTREQMAARAAKELKDGFYVNLGIGISHARLQLHPKGMSVQLQSENGMLGMGPFPMRARRTPTSSTPASRRSPSCRPRAISPRQTASR